MTDSSNKTKTIKRKVTANGKSNGASVSKSSSSTKKKKATSSQVPPRTIVSKTYKMYVGGAFVRSERGRYLPFVNQEGKFVGNYVWATRKDFRNAMVVARKAQTGWAKRSAFNRSQILYRIAEMLEDRRSLFVQRLQELAGETEGVAQAEVDAAVDRIFWYAGWCDKFAQVLGGINPVASPFFNFTVPEPTGVVTILAPQNSPLLGLVSSLMPVILSGNTCITIVENNAPTIAVDFAEVLATSDVPGGVVNILTGKRDELISHIAQHMDLNAIACYGGDPAHIKELQTLAAGNVKRVEIYEETSAEEWYDESMQSLYRISPFIEWKTAWHPIGI